MWNFICKSFFPSSSVCFTRQMMNMWKNSNAQTHNSDEAKESERKMHRNNLTQQNQNKTKPHQLMSTRCRRPRRRYCRFCDISFFFFGAADIFDYIFLAQRKLSGRTAAKMRVRMDAKERENGVYILCGVHGCLFCASMRPLVDLVWLCTIKSQSHSPRHTSMQTQYAISVAQNMRIILSSFLSFHILWALSLSQCGVRVCAYGVQTLRLKWHFAYTHRAMR